MSLFEELFMSGLKGLCKRRSGHITHLPFCTLLVAVVCPECLPKGTILLKVNNAVFEMKEFRMFFFRDGLSIGR